MPIVNISVAQGRTPEQLRHCLTAVHEAVCASLGVPAASVRVLLTEVPPALWSSGGTTLEERGRRADAVASVREPEDTAS
ncbi:tautomerase family protein [Streptomyces sp. NPDC026672]|uniref:tautomerase family protein n=1 Tax=unclassified Streptomyces TaxID=2593676 RepID=UPI0033DBC09D